MPLTRRAALWLGAAAALLPAAVRAAAAAPNLPLTLSLVLAGNGPDAFDTAVLVRTLSGSDAELGRLTHRYGAAKVESFVKTFDHIVADALKIVTDKQLPLPDAPAVDPKDGRGLAAALYAAGSVHGTFDVETLFDALLSPPIHDRVMHDVEMGAGGGTSDANVHTILGQLFADLRAQYHLR
jgi:hypothetical protein